MSSEPAPPPTSTPSSRPVPDGSPGQDREIAYEHTPSFTQLLEQLGCSLLVSTYQAGKLAVVGAHESRLTLSVHNFERAMGIAVRPDKIAIGANRQVWFLNDAPDVAPRLPPAGRYDACYLARTALYTGDIHVHELAFGGEGGRELWCVNTMFSCLCTLDDRHSFVPQWRPPFVTALAAEDRCHLNGLALDPQGRPAYVTVLGQTDTAGGWRANKVSGGCVLDVPSGEPVLRDLAMPHSPRLHRGNLWVLDSGRGRLLLIDRAAGRGAVAAELPGYTRGLAMHGDVAFVGLSRIRESNVFGGMPIAERRDELKCGVGAVDLRSGRLLGHLEFKTGVEEIFAVEVLPGVRQAALSGPYPHLDGAAPIWHAPPMPNPPLVSPFSLG